MPAPKGGSDPTIESFRGGLNLTDPQSMLPVDQVVVSLNVEYFETTLGERRRGTQRIDVSGSGLVS